MAEKKQDFVVSDRRRFGAEGEARPDAPVAAEEASPAPSAPAAPPAAEQGAAPAPPKDEPASPAQPEQMPPPPTAAEQQEQRDAYHASGKKLEEIIEKSGARRESPEMTFDRLVESFYMTALLQLGAVRQEGDPPAVDIMGARQTIDSLNILQEKTKGNLSDREQTLLQNVLFELRMAWIEITNALTAAVIPPGGPVADKK